MCAKVVNYLLRCFNLAFFTINMTQRPIIIKKNCNFAF